ncbi:hypothetical protein [Yersinia pekkanenii]|uniref:Membrane protein n=1 Tax=Yersinia pekkanenii TaxID=1288385 RepID=A0A0T9Q8S0_9GAMM|nr:hypothetical protein [Yersinia pekkanenii]CNI00864.1 membrane protein [Yersinia pekkanenii]CRY63574.1 membrane protein [Yersinia pekkanenii]
MKKKQRENDLDVKKELKEMDSCAVYFYLAIPFILLIIGGKKLASYTPLIWFGYSIIYIIAFNSFIKSLSSNEEISIAKLSKTYAGHHMSWIILVLTLLIFIFSKIPFLP